MSHHASRRPAALARLAAFRADEAGSARTDVIVAGLAVIAILGILIMSDMNSPDPVAADGTAAGGAAAPARTVSSTGVRLQEPQAVPGSEARRSYASPGFEDRLRSTPDRERAVLEEQTELARAAAAAAGSAEPSGEAAQTAVQAPAADDALAAGENADAPPAGDGG